MVVAEALRQGSSARSMRSSLATSPMGNWVVRTSFSINSSLHFLGKLTRSSTVSMPSAWRQARIAMPHPHYYALDGAVGMETPCIRGVRYQPMASAQDSYLRLCAPEQTKVLAEGQDVAAAMTGEGTLDLRKLVQMDVLHRRSMVPSLDELGIWELVGDCWSDAARPEPEADVRLAWRSELAHAPTGRTGPSPQANGRRQLRRRSRMGRRRQALRAVYARAVG